MLTKVRNHFYDLPCEIQSLIFKKRLALGLGDTYNKLKVKKEIGRNLVLNIINGDIFDPLYWKPMGETYIICLDLNNEHFLNVLAYINRVFNNFNGEDNWYKRLIYECMVSIKWWPMYYSSYEDTEDMIDYKNNRQRYRINYMVAKTYALHIAKKSSLYSQEMSSSLGLSQMYSMI